MRRAHIWGWARTRRCDEPSNDLGPSSRHQSYPDCIIATHGYDFWEGQRSNLHSLGAYDRRRRKMFRGLPRLKTKFEAKNDCTNAHGGTTASETPAGRDEIVVLRCV